MLYSLFGIVVVLGIVVFIHELGHFTVARLCGVGVEKFSLGFGPRLFGRTKGMTDYRVSAIPLGGYVKMVGEDPDSGDDLSEAEKAMSFSHKPVHKKMAIVAAGPLSNVLLGFVIFYFLFLIHGMFITLPVVGKTLENTPAWEAGLSEGDIIRKINGIAVDSWDDMAARISESKGKPISLTVETGNGIHEFSITPKRRISQNLFGEETERFMIGIAPSGEYRQERLGPISAFSESLRQTWNVGELIVVGIYKIIKGTISAKTIGGPIMIAEMAGEQAKMGPSNLFFFVALISVNLAILNILPIPVLDGGHLLFFTMELILGRPVSIKTREIAQQVGIFLLLLLMVFAFYNDITRVLFGNT